MSPVPPAVEPGGDIDARLALELLETPPLAPPSPRAQEDPDFVAQIQRVRDVMRAFDALGVAAGAKPLPPPCPSWGPFALKEQLGRGSFGVVCRGFDPAVAREIAVKLYVGDELPAEPRLMARVRHPNVVTVFGAAVHDGRPGIWMELIHGRTLAERAHSEGPLALDEVVRIGIELCGALQAVHDQHLVHRDVKPRNVMEQDDGRIVLMDFGAGSARSGTDVPIERLSGTPLFMAPEVVLGGAPSAQSDIYSLGVLLFYLLTGTYPLYAGDFQELRALHERQNRSGARRFAAVLRELRPELPHTLARCVTNALAPAGSRYRSATELRSALERVQRESRTVGRWAAASRAFRGSLRPLWVGAIALAISAAAVGLWPARPSAPPARTVLLRRLTWDNGLTTDPALSADGKLLAYASDRSGDGNLDIWVQQLADGVPLRLTTDPADDSQPSFSPDGSTIVFRSERDGGGLYLVPVFGGAARLIARGGHSARFSPDGRHVAYLGGDSAASLFIITPSGGLVRKVDVEAPTDSSAVVWSPDSRYVLLLGFDPSASRKEQDWWVVPVTDTGTRGSGAIRTGAFALFRAHSLFSLDNMPLPRDWKGHRILFDAPYGDTLGLWDVEISKSFRIDAPPRQLTVSADAQLQPALGPDGRIVFATQTGDRQLWALPLDANRGQSLAAPHFLTSYSTHGPHAISADGRWLAFMSGRQGKPDIWLKDLRRGTETAIASGPSAATFPVMTPDGSRILYRAADAQSSVVYSAAIAGGAPEKVCSDCGAPTDWSRDRRYVLLQSVSADVFQKGRRMVASAAVLDMASGQRSEILGDHQYEIYRCHFSPDGRWVAFHVARSDGSTRECIAAFNGLAHIDSKDWIAVTDGHVLTDTPRWAPDGNMLYYISDRDGFRCIWAQRLEPATKRPLGEPTAVRHFHSRQHSIANLPIRGIDLSVASDTLVFNLGQIKGDIWIAEPK